MPDSGGRMSTKAFETSSGEKQNCRELICSIADEQLGQANIKKIFTLPSREALCYHTFKKHYKKAKVVCIERDTEIWRYLCEVKDIDCVNTTISEYSKERVSREQHHDIVFLDYYSFLSKKILEDVQGFVTNDNIVHANKKFVLAITLQKNIRRDKDTTISLLKDYIYRGNKKDIQNTIENVSIGITNYISCNMMDFKEVKLVEAKEYRANKNSADMYFIVISVEK